MNFNRSRTWLVWSQWNIHNFKMFSHLNNIIWRTDFRTLFFRCFDEWPVYNLWLPWTSNSREIIWWAVDISMITTLNSVGAIELMVYATLFVPTIKYLSVTNYNKIAKGLNLLWYFHDPVYAFYQPDNTARNVPLSKWCKSKQGSMAMWMPASVSIVSIYQF